MTEQSPATKPQVVPVAMPITVLPAPEGLRAVAIAGRVIVGAPFLAVIRAALAVEPTTQDSQ